MKLYYSTGACSLAAHIALAEVGLQYDLAKVNLKNHQLADGGDFYAINPKGYVPALAIDGEPLLTEVSAVLQYIADQKPSSGLAPAAGTMARYRLQEWLSYIGTEVHKVLGSLFYPSADPAVREATVKKISGRLDYITKAMGNHPYLMGDTFTVADAYLYVVLNWAPMLKVDLGPWPAIQQYMARIAARPGVQTALRAEGLLK